MPNGLPETKTKTPTFTKVGNMRTSISDVLPLISDVLPLQLHSPSVGLNAKSALQPSALLKQIGETTACGSTSIIRQESSKTVILYLIRHGEASHNVLEKAAKKRAKEECIAEGYAPDSPEVKQAMEEARKSVLHDVNLFDASLSDLGRQEATTASKQLQELVVANNGLILPEEVLVSPLTRTLETADLIFPDHANIRVREELRERQTGLPPDSRRSTATLRRRPTFHRFSMSRIRGQSMTNFELPQFAQLFLGDDSDDEDFLNCDDSSDYSMIEETEEDKQMLRKRTKKLFELLIESEHSSLAIVTHKGYLRELERGQFEQPDAKEFNNCEVRVYRVTVGADKALECAERIA
jgi:broad specificity phosphatase PhoE